MPYNINEIIEQIKQIPTNDKRISEIMKLPNDLKILVLYNFEDIFIRTKPRSSKPGFHFISGQTIEYTNALYSIIRSLPEKQKIEFLTSQNDLFKKNYINDCENIGQFENDSIILSLIQSTSDFPYKTVFASKIVDKSLKTKLLKGLGVNDSLIYYINELQVKPTSSSIKYPSIGLPEEMTFGLEIECYNRDYATVLRDFKNLLTQDFLGQWSCKRDPTISEIAKEKNNIHPDLEVVSGVLSDTDQNVQQIYDICGFLNDLGFQINEHCGGHIHIGRNYIETPKQLWNLIKIYGICTDVMNLIINKPGSLPRDSMERFAKSTYKLLYSNNFNFNNYTDVDECIAEIQRLQNGKEYDINISTSNPTYEFRSANSILNPNAWVENIKLFGTLMIVAKSLETGNLENFEQKKELFSKLKSEKDIRKKCELILNLLFDNEKDRAIYRERFEQNYALQIKMQDLKDLCTDKTNESEGRNG